METSQRLRILKRFMRFSTCIYFIFYIFNRSKKTQPKKYKKKEDVETDVTGFQSVRRTSKRTEEDESSPRGEVVDGMDDIQRFREEMKAKEVISKGGQLVIPATNIQSANIFDVLDQLEHADVSHFGTASDGSKSKFDKLFNKSSSDDKEYEKVVQMLANSLKKEVSDNDDSDSLAALLSSSIKGKKNKINV